jgi:hypothetical protein
MTRAVDANKPAIPKREIKVRRVGCPDADLPSASGGEGVSSESAMEIVSDTEPRLPLRCDKPILDSFERSALPALQQPAIWISDAISTGEPAGVEENGVDAGRRRQLYRSSRTEVCACLLCENVVGRQ